jgi:hypothetical protein
VFTPVQASLMQAACHVLDQPEHVGPGGGLPDAVLFLAHGSAVGALGRVFHQQLGERGPHEIS